MSDNPQSPSPGRERLPEVRFNLPEPPSPPERRRALRKSVTADRERDQVAEETRTPEAVPQRPRMSVEQIRKKAEKIESDPNVGAAESIRQLNGSKELFAQREGLLALNTALVSVLGKLTKKGVDVSKLNTPEKLQKAVTQNNLVLSLPEQTAVESLGRIVQQAGPTATQIRESWPDTIEAGNQKGTSYWKKYKEHFKKDPAGTTALTIAGAAGIYLGYQAIKGLMSKMFGSETADQSKDKKSWFKKEVMIPVMIMGAGAFLGKERVKQLMTDAGLDYFGLKDKVKKGEEFTAEQKRKIKEGGPVVQEQIERMREEHTASTESAEGVDEAVADESRERTRESAEDLVKHQLPQDLLIELYCHNEYEYSEQDVLQIRNVMDDFQDKSITDVLRVWDENKNGDLIPARNALGNFEDGIEEKNIFMAVKIIALTALEFQKRSKNPDFLKQSVKNFLENLVNTDPALKVTQAVQETLITTISSAGITDLMKLNDLDFKVIEAQLESIGSKAWEGLAIDFGIDLEGINKTEFALMLIHLQKRANIGMSTEAAFALPDFPQSDEKTTAAMKLFYEKVRERTLQNIIPAAVQRYNIGADIVSNAGNADIIKNHLNDRISFKRGLYLTLVTKSMDLSKPTAEGGSTTDEMAFLFTVLSSIPKEQKARYISELTVVLSQHPEKMPSLALIKPYFSKVAEFGFDYIKNQANAAGYWLSAIMPNRSPEEQEAFLHNLRDKSFVQWGAEMGREGTGGSLAVAKEFIVPFIESGKVTVEQLGQCEDVWDFMLLVKEAGGTFLYTKDENGEPHGMIHFLGDTFVFRPLGIVQETFDAALDGEVSEALKVWTGGSAPFVTYGAAHGWWVARLGREGQKGWLPMIRARGAAKGALKGMAYPYYALRTSYRAGKYAASTVLNLPTAAVEYASRPGQTARRIGRRASDFMEYRSLWPGQNVPNMLENGQLFQRYFEGSNLTELNLREKIHSLTQDPKVLLRRLSSTFNNRMTLRYAARFAHDYNAFFQFDKGANYKILVGEIINGSETEVGKTMSRHARMREFLSHADSYSEYFDEMRVTMKRGLKGDALNEALANSIRKMKGIEPDEARALAKQMLKEKDINRLQQRMTGGLAAFKETTEAVTASRASLASRVRERFRGASEAERTRGFGKVSEALQKTRGELDSVTKRLATAERDLNLAHRMRSQEGIDKARAIMQEAEVAKIKLNNSIASLELVQEAEKNLKSAATGNPANIAHLEEQLGHAVALAEDELRASGTAVQEVGRFGKLARGAKLLGRTASWAGAGVSVWLAMDSAYEAVSTDVEGRGSVKGAEALMWTLDSAAGLGSAAVLAGSTSTAATIASYAAAPLIPLTYAGSKVFETQYEETVTDYEWAQKNPYELLHHFYTSTNSASLGDAWSTLGIESRINKSLDAKTETMHKIFRGLVAIQKDPELLNYIQTEPASGKKDKEVQRRIETNYSVYHEFYFRNTVPTGLQSYSSAHKFILDAQMYDDLMQTRQRAKEAGESFVIEDGNSRFTLNEERYDILGGMDNPQARVTYSPEQLVKAYKGSVLKEILKDPVMTENLERMDSAYLTRLYVQMNLAMRDESMQTAMRNEPALALAMKNHMGLIRNYLCMKRDLNFDLAIRNAEFFEPRMSLLEITTHLESMGQLDNTAFKKFEKEQYSMTPALHSLYKLAQYFGYAGTPTEGKLKEFFTADAASFRGIYWNGDEWVVQEEGWESDNELGSKLNEATIKRMIKELREDPDNVLEHRHDSIFVSAYDYEHEVLKMADILQSGLEERQRFEQEGPLQSVQPSEPTS